jgi:hypothetical protein
MTVAVGCLGPPPGSPGRCAGSAWRCGPRRGHLRRAGIAILRYRLYDIDRISNRTLVYGLLTAVLGLGDAAVVLALGQLFGGISDEAPGWAVAGATLAVAALFQPARRRIQTVVDRRLDRRRHDAAKTIEVFRARLRDEVDLDTLSGELLAVVDQASPRGRGAQANLMQPVSHQDVGGGFSP